ncbi:hypothetical protein NIES2104_55620 [Leptolyngbya sp. NIES-2104]|nr:hypothetical protein NIES2104_55620 [Leptolyngbya sp. NIES-2104]
MASNWNVLVETTEDGKAIATILELPTLSAIADTQQDAIDLAQQLLAERLTHAKIVPIQIESSEGKSVHPALKSAGIFKAAPQFEEVQRHIQEYRDELDALDEGESPIAKFAGIFKDDPDFAEIVNQMRAEREQLDEE